MSAAKLFWLEGARFESNVAAAGPWWRDAVIPDVVNHVDTKHRPDLVARAIQGRVDADFVFALPHLMRYPKPNGGLRVMTVLDPVDELGLRQLVGRLVPSIEKALSPRVHHSRAVLLSEGVWRTEDWRTARRRFESAIRDARRVGDWHGMGTLDVKDHYATLNLDDLGLILHSAGCSDGAVFDTLNWLGRLANRSGQRGLPVGPEASAPLGTVALAPLDRLLEGSGAVHVRYMDDEIVCARSEKDYQYRKWLAGNHLAMRGQALNDKKCNYEVFGSDDAVVLIEELSLGWNGPDGVDAPTSILAKSIELRESRDAARAVGQLRAEGDPGAAALVLHDPWLLFRLPKQIGGYLARVRNDIRHWDRIMELIFEDTTDETAAGQLWLTRILDSRNIGASVARDLFEKGRGLDRFRFAPLANELFAAAGRGQQRLSQRQLRGAETALELTDLNAQRALLAACVKEPPVAAVRPHLHELSRRESGLAPMLSLIAA